MCYYNGLNVSNCSPSRLKSGGWVWYGLTNPASFSLTNRPFLFLSPFEISSFMITLTRSWKKGQIVQKNLLHLEFEECSHLELKQIIILDQRI